MGRRERPFKNADRRKAARTYVRWHFNIRVFTNAPMFSGEGT